MIQNSKLQTPNSKLIVALDVDDLKKAEKLVNDLHDVVKIFKIGSQLFTAYGPRAVEMVHKKGCKTFLDLKFHDIPNTVAHAAKEAVKMGVFMFNMHCLGGEAMLKAAVDAVLIESDRLKIERPIVLGVTILTSIEQDDLSKIGIEKNLQQEVLSLAGLAKKSGVDGVVASAKDVNDIKEKLGNNFLVVCPGIRPPGGQIQDQKRVVTLDEAIVKKADYIVVGRPITQADKPREVAQWITKQL